MSTSAAVYGFYKVSVTTDFIERFEIKKQEEAEIASSAEHLCKDSVNSLVTKTKYTLSSQVVRERRTNPRRRMI